MSLLPILALVMPECLRGDDFERADVKRGAKHDLCHYGVVVAMALAVGGLSGCDQVKKLTQRTTNASAVASTTVDQTVSSTGVVSTDTGSVTYPFIQWQQQTVTKLPLQDIARITQHLTQTLGHAPTTDTKSLDFYSNPATQYQFAKPAMPYFDVIDSPKFIELGWYYPNAKDQAQEKKMGISYAGQVYQLARGWMGNREGAQLVEYMLTGQTIRNQSINGVEVAMAKCEFFSCMLVLKK